MISAYCKPKTLVLCYAGESLLKQAADWVQKQPNLLLQLVSSHITAVIREAMFEVSGVIIDVTERPDEAMDVFQYAAGRVEGRQLAVYTERNHEGLEIFVRMRGAFLLLGPLTPTEWEAYFDSLQPADTGFLTGTSVRTEPNRHGKTIHPHSRCATGCTYMGIQQKGEGK